MIMKKIKNDFCRFTLVLLQLLLVVMFSVSCEPDLSDDPIPYVPFATLTINTNLPEFQTLHTRGYAEINDIGVRGVILYKQDASTYRAYERNCSYHPADACATVSVHVSNIYMIDNCCNSTFDFATGNPTGGPAWRPLRQYATSASGSQVTISSDIVN
jgi:nitrite reductase/ring-hydroxylating ferredoxin subunit